MSNNKNIKDKDDNQKTIEKQNAIKANIATALYEYKKDFSNKINVYTGNNKQIPNISEQNNVKTKKELTSVEIQKNIKPQRNQNSILINFIKLLLVFCIIITSFCIITALIIKSRIDLEETQITEQIKNKESSFFSKQSRYYYTSKTEKDKTLGIDLSEHKYFTSFEIVQKEGKKDYEIKLYGATNAFEMTYYYFFKSIKDKK